VRNAECNSQMSGRNTGGGINKRAGHQVEAAEKTEEGRGVGGEEGEQSRTERLVGPEYISRVTSGKRGSRGAT